MTEILLRSTFRVCYRASEVNIELDGVPIGLARDLAALIGKHLCTEVPAEHAR